MPTFWPLVLALASVPCLTSASLILRTAQVSS